MKTLFCSSCFMAVLIGIQIGRGVEEKRMTRLIVESGRAHYVTNNGSVEWAWKWLHEDTNGVTIMKDY